MHPDLLALAEQQFGVVSRRQALLRLGSSRGQVDGLVQRGWLRPVLRGVYLAAGAPLTAEGGAMAAVLRAGPPSRLSGPLVLGLHGIDGFTARDPGVLLRPPGRRPGAVGMLHVWDADPDADAAPLGALPATTPERALLESAWPALRVEDRRLLQALDDLRGRARLRVADLHERALSMPRHAAAARWRRLLATADARSESAGERRLGAVLDTITPRPERQATVGRYRPDFWYPRLRLDLEYDGRRHHDRQRDRDRDRRRDTDLGARGVRVVRLRAEDLRDPGLRARVVRLLRERADELGLHLPIG